MEEPLASVIQGESYLEIKSLSIILSKHEQVRVDLWVRAKKVKKISRISAKSIWKSNHCKYAELLLQMVQQGKLQEPFSKLPPEGPLPKYESVCGRASVRFKRPNKNLSHSVENSEDCGHSQVLEELKNELKILREKDRVHTEKRIASVKIINQQNAIIKELQEQIESLKSNQHSLFEFNEPSISEPPFDLMSSGSEYEGILLSINNT